MNIVNLVVRMLVNECESCHKKAHEHLNNYKEFSKILEKKIYK